MDQLRGYSEEVFVDISLSTLGIIKIVSIFYDHSQRGCPWVCRTAVLVGRGTKLKEKNPYLGCVACEAHSIPEPPVLPSDDVTFIDHVTDKHDIIGGSTGAAVVLESSGLYRWVKVGFFLPDQQKLFAKSWTTPLNALLPQIICCIYKYLEQKMKK